MGILYFCKLIFEEECLKKIFSPVKLQFPPMIFCDKRGILHDWCVNDLGGVFPILFVCVVVRITSSSRYEKFVKQNISQCGNDISLER